MDREKLIAELVEELSIISGMPVSAVTDLHGDADLDSFGTVQVIAFLEDSYGIEVPEEMLATQYYRSVETIAGWALPMIRSLAPD